MAREVNNSANARLHMGKLNDMKLTVGDIRSGEMARVVNTDIGYTVLEQVRTSPFYMRKIRKQLFAKIRQIGSPKWFATWNADDTHYAALIRALFFLKNKKQPSPAELEICL